MGSASLTFSKVLYQLRKGVIGLFHVPVEGQQPDQFALADWWGDVPKIYKGVGDLGVT